LIATKGPSENGGPFLLTANEESFGVIANWIAPAHRDARNATSANAFMGNDGTTVMAQQRLTCHSD
jgi:hypothetical protein